MSEKVGVKVWGIFFSIVLIISLIPIWFIVINLPIGGLFEKIFSPIILGYPVVDWFIWVSLFTLATISLCRGKHKNILMVFVNINMAIIWYLFEIGKLGLDSMASITLILSITALTNLAYAIVFATRNAYQISGPKPSY
jgi:hypothetical protein